MFSPHLLENSGAWTQDNRLVQQVPYLLNHLFITLLCVLVAYGCVMVHVWRSEHRWRELLLSFHPAGSVDRIQVIGLGRTYLSLPAKPSCPPPSLRFCERTRNCISLWRFYLSTLILRCIPVLGAVMYERLCILEIKTICIVEKLGLFLVGKYITEPDDVM